MKKLIIVGAGGFGADAAWVAEAATERDPANGFEIVGLVDDDPTKRGADVYGYPCLGPLEEAAGRFTANELWYHCALGDNRARQAAVARCEALKLRAATLVHPSVLQAGRVAVGEGCYIGPLSVLHPYVTVGRHVVINARVGVGHHATVGDFAQLCPGVQISGACRIGEGAFFGSNATIVQQLSVGAWAVVGASSLVTSDVHGDVRVLGVPARRFFPT
jgi:sugar O-acyltransferase (sialic acid O-acetyltransferase NeuD family)